MVAACICIFFMLISCTILLHFSFRGEIAKMYCCPTPPVSSEECRKPLRDAEGVLDTADLAIPISVCFISKRCTKISAKHRTGPVEQTAYVKLIHQYCDLSALSGCYKIAFIGV